MKNDFSLLLLIPVLLFLSSCQVQNRETGISRASTASKTPEIPGQVNPVQTISEAFPSDDISRDVMGSASATTGYEVPPTTPTIKLTDTPKPTLTPSHPIYSGPRISRYDAGVQVHIHREDLDEIFKYLRLLGVGWVKVQVSWKLYQPQDNQFDDFRWQELDRFVELAQQEEILVMLGVAKAPEWSRPTTELDGPPADSGHFYNFISYLADRYRGRVAAYELWNEPNLQREWNGVPLNASVFVNLVRSGAAGIRQADPGAIVISGAPATTGINDGITAIDDRIYFKQMVADGITEVVDAVGAHPYGWANPPDSSSDNPPPDVPTHNDHPSFYFADTVSDYRAILDQVGETMVPIWGTEFGWGSYDGLGRSPPSGLEYMAYVTEQQQAAYILGALEYAQNKDWLGPLILWNLNFGPTFGPDFDISAYSILRPDGSPRPAFKALAAIPWIEVVSKDGSGE